MEKKELKQIRRGRMSKSERVREWSAKITRMFVLFGAPVVLSIVMIFIVAIIYIVRPYFLTKNFARTICEVSGYSLANETRSSCSAGTDPFDPCLKIEVTYATGVSYESGIIMENEQALVICNRCSYTFGKHGLLHQYQEECNSWRDDFDPYTCLQNFIAKHAVRGTTYPCYFNPNKPNEVVQNLVIDSNSVIHAIAWPILISMIFFLALAFVFYDSKQAKILDDYIKAEIEHKQKQQNVERLRVHEWRKQKLGQSLGVRGSGASPSSNSVLRSPVIMKRSGSVPSLRKCSINAVPQSVDVESLDDLENNDESALDLRHLDLAVSQRNISDLTLTYPYVQTHPPLTYENPSTSNEGNGTHSVNIERGRAPRMPCSPSKIARRRKTSTTLFLRDEDYVSVSKQRRASAHQVNNGSRSSANKTAFHPCSNVITESQNIYAVEEDEIDGYYSAERRRSLFYSNNPATQTVDMLSGEKEYRV